MFLVLKSPPTSGARGKGNRKKPKHSNDEDQYEDGVLEMMWECSNGTQRDSLSSFSETKKQESGFSGTFLTLKQNNDTCEPAVFDLS